jgi:hypothetical protein
MTNQLARESNRPSNVGDDGNLPPDVRAVAGLRSYVIAWTTKDPKYGCDCATTVRMACVIACFPLFFYKAIIPPEHNRAHWILTETELKFVIVNHEEYFLPGIKQTKDIVHTIPLDKITACGVRNSYWYWSSPYIYVDVSESYRDYGIMESTHTAVAPALAGQDWFAQEILHRRNTLKGTVGTVIRLDDIPSPSTKTYGQVAPFGNHDNAPNTMRQWAQQGQPAQARHLPFHSLVWDCLVLCFPRAHLVVSSVSLPARDGCQWPPFASLSEWIRDRVRHYAYFICIYNHRMSP